MIEKLQAALDAGYVLTDTHTIYNLVWKETSPLSGEQWIVCNNEEEETTTYQTIDDLAQAMRLIKPLKDWYVYVVEEIDET